MMKKSAVAEDMWENYQSIHWEEATVLDNGRGQDLLVKEALHMQMTPPGSASTKMDWKSLVAGPL